ncbi:unnamed protein product [Linum trigynum]|uniref:Uncharacterized protein n=1 Tax=Linum trigynum TaxID=586398 RepID=A0AAV2CX92_9ROSI
MNSAMTAAISTIIIVFSPSLSKAQLQPQAPRVPVTAHAETKGKSRRSSTAGAVNPKEKNIFEGDGVVISEEKWESLFAG